MNAQKAAPKPRDSAIRPIQGTLDVTSHFPRLVRMDAIYRYPDGMLELRIIRWEPDRKRGTLEVIRSHASGGKVTLTSADGFVVAHEGSKPEKMFKLRVAQGELWPVPSLNRYRRVAGLRDIVVGRRLVRDCLVLDRIWKLKQKEQFLMREYFAPGEGLVRTEHDGGGTVERVTSVDPTSATMAVMRLKQQVPGVRYTPWRPGQRFNPGVGVSGNMRVIATRPGFEIVVWQGWGDCQSGCTHNRYTYFTVSPSGAIEQLGAFGDRLRGQGIEGTPLWGIPSLPQRSRTSDPGKLREYLADSRWWFRRYGIDRLAEIDPARHRPAFEAALKDRRWQVRAAAARALSRTGRAGALIPLLQDPNTQVVAQVLRVLRWSRDARTLRAVTGLLANPDRDVRVAAARALAAARYRPALPAIHRIVTGWSDFTTKGVKALESIVEALPLYNDVACMPTLIQLLRRRTPFLDGMYGVNVGIAGDVPHYWVSSLLKSAARGCNILSGKQLARWRGVVLSEKETQGWAEAYERWWQTNGKRRSGEPVVVLRRGKLAELGDGPREEIAFNLLLDAGWDPEDYMPVLLKWRGGLFSFNKGVVERLLALDRSRILAFIKAHHRDDPKYQSRIWLERYPGLCGTEALIGLRDPHAANALERRMVRDGHYQRLSLDYRKRYRQLLRERIREGEDHVVEIAARLKATELLSAIRAALKEDLFQDEEEVKKGITRLEQAAKERR